MVALAVADGYGRHSAYLTTVQISEISKWLVISQQFWTIGMPCSRISITLFLMRVLVIKKVWRTAARCFIAFMATSYLAFFVQFFPLLHSDRDLVEPGREWNMLAYLALDFNQSLL